MTNTTEKEQHKIPLHVENLLSRLLDQLNTDTDVRNEENMTLHTSIISWMVHLLVKAGKEKPSDAWDHQFGQLTQEIASFNANLLRDCVEIDTTAEDGKNLKESIRCEQQSRSIVTAARILHGSETVFNRTYSGQWTTVAKRLLASEKQNAAKYHAKPLRPLSAKVDELEDDARPPPAAAAVPAPNLTAEESVS